MKTGSAIFLVLGLAALTAGCETRRVTYVPVYPAHPAYQPQPVYAYPGQAAYATAPANGGQLVTTAPATTDPYAQAGATAVPAQPAPPPNATVVAPVAPPQPQVEMVPVAPGSDYAWTPGYWNWNGVGWIWIGGGWVIRPGPRAIWIGPRWERHGRGYVWRGGHWR
jgi:WXXGXW repeat (2 copies)